VQEVYTMHRDKVGGEFRYQNFYLQMPEIFISAQGTANVELMFVPMTLGRHQCSILLIDEQGEAGEVEYRFEARCGYPQAFIYPHVQQQMDDQHPIEVPILVQNPLYENAKGIHLQ
jgi:hypothetical protein